MTRYWAEDSYDSDDGHIHRVSVKWSDGNVWLYQYESQLWAKTVEQIMSDLREGKLPEVAARSLVQAVAEFVTDDD